MNRARKPKASEGFMNLTAIEHFLLNTIGAFAMGAVTALLPKGMEPAAVEVTKRGVEVLIQLLHDQVENHNGRDRIPLNIHVLFRGDSMGPSAGEIMANIQKGLVENPFKGPDGMNLDVRHVINSHACLRPACFDELVLSKTPSLDLHTATFALTLAEPEKTA